MIYPVDSTIQHLNNWGLVDSIIHLLNSWGQVYSSKCKQPYYLKYRLGTYIYPYEGLLYPGNEYGYGLGVSDSDCSYLVFSYLVFSGQLTVKEMP